MKTAVKVSYTPATIHLEIVLRKTLSIPFKTWFSNVGKIPDERRFRFSRPSQTFETRNRRHLFSIFPSAIVGHYSWLVFLKSRNRLRFSYIRKPTFLTLEGKRQLSFGLERNYHSKYSVYFDSMNDKNCECQCTICCVRLVNEHSYVTSF